jgi:2-methylisocitrate lyase-like PEP mutase family enzyme
MTQTNKAKYFKSLHVAGKPLVLYNIWDAGSAICLAEQGASAIATGSLSVAADQGFTDGEEMPLHRALETAQQIAQSVDVPVSLDFEGGYAQDLETLTANVKAVITTGVIGINFEDRIVKGEGLYTLPEQVSRLTAVRQAADQQDIALFLNARTDIFLQTQTAKHSEALANQALGGPPPLPKQALTDFSFPALPTPL